MTDPKLSQAFPLMYVEWIDSGHLKGWNPLDEGLDPVFCQSVGYLFAEDDEAIRLGANLGRPHVWDEPDQANGAMVIPKVAITHMRQLSLNTTDLVRIQPGVSAGEAAPVSDPVPLMEQIELLDELAAELHTIWQNWSTLAFQSGVVGEPNGGMYFNGGFMSRWNILVRTPYSSFSEAEKASARKEAARVLAVLWQRDPAEISA